MFNILLCNSTIHASTICQKTLIQKEILTAARFIPISIYGILHQKINMQIHHYGQRKNELKKNHILVATIEDGSLDGGFGERIARFYGPSDMKVINFGVKKKLYDRYEVSQLLADNHLTEEQMVEDIKKAMK